jgi:hypothetical protein
LTNELAGHYGISESLIFNVLLVLGVCPGKKGIIRLNINQVTAMKGNIRSNRVIYRSPIVWIGHRFFRRNHQFLYFLKAFDFEDDEARRALQIFRGLTYEESMRMIAAKVGKPFVWNDSK